jgi:hypothetical protein
MDMKPNKNQSPKAETVYIVDTLGGKEYEVTKEDYEGLNKIIEKGEVFGVYIVNERTTKQAHILVKHIVATRTVERTFDRIV